MARCKQEAQGERDGPAVQNNGDGYITIRRPDEGGLYGGYCYGPEATKLIALTATESLAKRDNAAVLIGGPQHGKVIRFSYTGMNVVRLPRSAPVKLPPPPGVYVAYVYDDYFPTGAFTFAEGKCCAILEHSDLGKLKRLEATIDDLTQKHEVARERINRASSEKAAAELAREDIGRKLAKLCEERDRLKWKHHA